MKTKTPKIFRPHNLELVKNIGVTQQTHFQLRMLKKTQSKSMAQIVFDLVQTEYEKLNKIRQENAPPGSSG